MVDISGSTDFIITITNGSTLSLSSSMTGSYTYQAQDCDAIVYREDNIIHAVIPNGTTYTLELNGVAYQIVGEPIGTAGTISLKLKYLNGTKTLIKDAILEKGVSVSDTDTFRSYADKIQSIEGGSAEPVVNMRLSNGVKEDEIVDGQKVIAVKTGEIPTEADTLTKITDFRNTSGSYYCWFFKNSYYDLMDSGTKFAYKKDSTGNFKAVSTFEIPRGKEKYVTRSGELPLLYVGTDGRYSDGTYQDREGNFDVITFDIEPEMPDNCKVAIQESYDGQYIYVFPMDTGSISVYPKVYIYAIDYTTKINANFVTSCEIPILYGLYWSCPSCNDYSIAIRDFNSYSYTYLLDFDKTTNTLSIKNQLTELEGGRYIVILTKDWCVSSKGTLYHLNSNKTVKASFSGLGYLQSSFYSNPVGNIFIQIYGTESGYSGLYVRSCPKDIAEPSIDDFGVNTSLDTNGGCFFFLSETELAVRWSNPAYQIYNYYTGEYTIFPFFNGGYIDYITDDGNVFCAWFYNETYKALSPVNGIYDGTIKESYSNRYSTNGSSGQPKYSVFLKDGTVESNNPTDDIPFISGLTITGPTSVSQSIYGVSAFEDALYLDNNGYPHFYLLADDLSYQHLTSGSQIKTDAFMFNGEYYGIRRDTGDVVKFILSGTSVTTEAVYTDSELKTQKWVGSLGITKDFKYLLSLNNGAYFEITTEDGVTPKVLKKEIPSVISTNCPRGNVQLVQCFYDKHFGVLLKNGWYYLFKYTESLEDTELVETIPPKISNTPQYYSFLYTSHRNYWIIRGGIFATCIGKSQTEPVGVDWTAFRNTDTYYNKGIITGFLTGEKVSDDGQGNRVVKVRAVLE